MANAAFPDHLRLVGSSDPQTLRQWERQKSAHQEVTRENQSAARNPTMDPTDPRWVLAVRAYAQLQGSTLTPERRIRVLKTAEHLGLRVFDANLIIAVVQDHARSGLPLQNAAGTLNLIREPVSTTHDQKWIWMRWLLAIGAAIVTSTWLILWLLKP